MNTDRNASSASEELTTSAEQVPAASRSLDFGFRTVSLTSRQMTALVYGGLLFLAASLASVGGLIRWTIRYVGLPPYQPRQGIPFSAAEMFNYYIAFFFNPVLLFFVVLVCAFVGYMMLRAAGAAGRETLPRQDYALLSHLVTEEKEKGIDLYVMLQSLTGTIGMFTKLWISGLPLATIVLTIIFSLLGLASGEAKLLDLANLTLGAFLGSYVQRRTLGTEESPRALQPRNTT